MTLRCKVVELHCWLSGIAARTLSLSPSNAIFPGHYSVLHTPTQCRNPVSKPRSCLRTRRQRPISILDIPDQILNRAHAQSPLLSKSQAVVSPHHSTTNKLRHARRHLLAIQHHLAQQRSRLLASQATQLDGRLGVALALAHAAVARAQRNDVARAAERGRPAGRIGQAPRRDGAVVRRDAGRHGHAVVCGVRVHRHRVRRPVRVLVVRHHCGELELRASPPWQRRADVPRCVPDHEGELCGCGVFGGDDQVAFVLAVGVV